MRPSWKTISASLAVGLLLGAAFGWWGHRMRLDSWRGEHPYQRLLERFTSRLDLTPEQQRQVGAILEGKRQRVHALRAEVRPRFDDIRHTTDDEIARLLTPGQREQFDTMKARREERRRKHHHPDE
ncbi:MAG: hypothetical protein HYT87_07040 [Nitrospirae bacterium]|nr:hypothetical protein [Nitrospirota bacterium]